MAVDPPSTHAPGHDLARDEAIQVDSFEPEEFPRVRGSEAVSSAARERSTDSG